MTGPEPVLEGILPLDKPRGLTSHDAVERIRRVQRKLKVGHTGTLDPQATGLLPLVVGSCTRLSRFLSASRKTYRGTIALGRATDTGDGDGQVVETLPVPALDREGLEQAMQGFLGSIQQVPPMYSAVKVEGVRLYARARRGETVERPSRTVRIHRFELLELREGELEIEVECGSGTYVRVLAEDLARALDTCGHLLTLRRVAVGSFTEADALPLSRFRGPQRREALAEALVPAAAALAHLPAARVAWPARRSLSRGLRLRPVAWELEVREPETPYVRVLDEEGRLAALAERPIDNGDRDHYGPGDPAPWVRVLLPLPAAL